MMTSALPIIDFAPFVTLGSSTESRLITAQEIDKACREVGFFYLKNHGVPAELMTAMLAKAREFFETSSQEEKANIAIRGHDNGGDNARGYLKVVNKVKGSHEAVDFYRPVETAGPPYTTGMGVNQWPKTALLRETSEAYIEKLDSLGRIVMQAIALGLGVEDSVFLDRIDQAFWNLRILGYEGRKEKAVNPAGIGEHTDFGILTFLLTDKCNESLQVLSRPGTWIWADPIEGCFLCNIGDMLAEWTRGAYKSTRHRVCHNSENLRISVPFFFDPNWDAYISPVLPAEGEDSDVTYQGIRYKDKFVRSVDYPLWRNPPKTGA